MVYDICCPKPLHQGCITATFKSTGAEVWKLVTGHTLFLQFSSHSLAEMNTKFLLKWTFFSTRSCYLTKKNLKLVFGYHFFYHMLDGVIRSMNCFKLSKLTLKELVSVIKTLEYKIFHYFFVTPNAALQIYWLYSSHTKPVLK